MKRNAQFSITAAGGEARGPRQVKGKSKAFAAEAQGSAIRVVAIPTELSNPGMAQAPGTVVGFTCVPDPSGSATCFVATR